MISADLITARITRKRELQQANMSLEDFAFRFTDYWDRIDFGGLNGPDWDQKIGGMDCRIVAAIPDFYMHGTSGMENRPLTAWRFHISCIPSEQAIALYFKGKAKPKVYNIAVHVFLTRPVPQVGSADPVDWGQSQVIIDTAALVSELRLLPGNAGFLCARFLQLAQGPTLWNRLGTIRNMENFYIAFTRAKNERNHENMHIYCHDVMQFNKEEISIATFRQTIEQRPERIPDMQENIVSLILQPETQIIAALMIHKGTLMRMVGGVMPPKGGGRQVSYKSIDFYWLRNGKITHMVVVWDEEKLEKLLNSNNE